MSAIEFKVENIYDGDTITNEFVKDLRPPEVDENLDEWAEEELFHFTGTGRESGNSAYVLTITACEDQPDLVDKIFEWGF